MKFTQNEITAAARKRENLTLEVRLAAATENWDELRLLDSMLRTLNNK